MDQRWYAKKRMKIVFLDIDGVLNLIPQGYDEFGAIWHPHFIDNLNKIINATGAKIVVSSSWRHSGIKYILDMWLFRKLPGQVIDITCGEVDIVRKGKAKFYDLVKRGHEIQDWLEQHPEVTHYVILDDDIDFLTNQLPHFVQTSNNYSHEDCVDAGYGLTDICTQQAIEILNKN